MIKLNQRIAAFKGIKSKGYNAVTKLHQDSQKVPLLSGIERTYQPRDDEGDHLPGESQVVQINLEELLQGVASALSPTLTEQLAIDRANRRASADVTVNGELLLVDVPVTYLMFLEKQLSDLATIVDKLPTLDPSQTWSADANAEFGIYRTPAVRTVKTKKVPRNHVKAPATDRHPAQVEVYHEDVVIGDWTTVRFSGAVPAVRKAQLKERVSTLLTAVKHAREEANQVDAPADPTEVGALLHHLLRP